MSGVNSGRNGIVKTTITITVLHRAGSLDGSGIDDVLYEMSQGEAVGWETDRRSAPVASTDVEHELKQLGNDGTFFDDDDDV